MESIKCHHNEITNYIKENLNITVSNTDVYLQNLKYFNFIYLSENNENDLDDSQILCNFCRCGCCSIVNHFIEDSRFNVNTQIIVEKEKLVDYGYKEITVTKKSNFSSIHFAVQKKNIELVNILLKRSDLDINLKGQFIEKKKNDDESEPSFEEKNREKTALLMAIENEDIKIIELLIKRKDIDINQKLKSTKFHEFQEYCCNYVGYILFKSKEIEKSQMAAIHKAIFTQKDKIIELLLSVKDIDLESEYVCEKKEWENLGGEKKEKENNYKKTAIQLANDYRNMRIITLLNNHKSIHGVQHRSRIIQYDKLKNMKL